MRKLHESLTPGKKTENLTQRGVTETRRSSRIIKTSAWVAESVVICFQNADRDIWKHTTLGNYSWQALRHEFNRHIPIAPFWRVIWQIFASLKVKSFILLLFQERLPLRAHFVRLRIISSQFNICSFCKSHEKDFSHTFILCNNINMLSYNVASMWNLSLVYPQNVHTLFDFWIHSKLAPQWLYPWCLAFYARVWSIWIMWNVIIFFQDNFNPNICLKLFWYYFA